MWFRWRCTEPSKNSGIRHTYITIFRYATRLIYTDVVSRSNRDIIYHKIKRQGYPILLWQFTTELSEHLCGICREQQSGSPADASSTACRHKVHNSWCKINFRQNFFKLHFTMKFKLEVEGPINCNTNNEEKERPDGGRGRTWDKHTSVLLERVQRSPDKHSSNCSQSWGIHRGTMLWSPMEILKIRNPQAYILSLFTLHWRISQLWRIFLHVE